MVKTDQHSTKVGRTRAHARVRDQERHRQMGQAKQRREPRFVAGDAPEVRALFDEADRPINVWTVGAGMVVAMMHTIPHEVLRRDPGHRPWRLAFGIYDRIRTGEMKNWTCFLCRRPRPGLKDLSCFGIIDRVPASQTNEAVILPICHSCDSVSSEETQRRMLEAFPLGPPLPEGTA